MNLLGLATTVVDFFVESIKKNKDVQLFFSDFASGTIDWIKPIFIKDDGTPEEIVKDLTRAPDEKIFQECLKLEIAKDVTKYPEKQLLLEQLVQDIIKKVGETTSGYSVNQAHFGTGDNVGRDKISNG